jgi:hypothetical protein
MEGTIMESSTLKEYSGSATEHMELIFPNNVPILRQILTQVLKHAAQNCINLKNKLFVIKML